MSIDPFYSRGSDILNNIKPKSKEDEEIVRIVQAIEQEPTTEIPKPSTESNEEKAKIENGGLTPNQPSNKLVDKNIEKDGNSVVENLKNNKIDSTKAKNDYYLVYGKLFYIKKFLIKFFKFNLF